MMALEMARTGADGDTKQQMGAVLYPGMSAEDGSMVLGRICKSLPDAEGARFHMSDSVWVKTADDVFVPDENFLDTVKRRMTQKSLAPRLTRRPAGTSTAWWSRRQTA